MSSERTVADLRWTDGHLEQLVRTRTCVDWEAGEYIHGYHWERVVGKRWNGKKMSHGRKSLERPLKKGQSKPAPKPKKK